MSSLYSLFSLIMMIHKHNNIMKTYLEYIKEKILNKEGTPQQRFLNLRCLVTSFHNEIVYLAYRYMQDQSINILKETERLKWAYCFNDIAWNAYIWSNSEMCKGWLEDLYKSKQLPLAEDMKFAWYYPKMQDYAFYDGTPVKDVMEEIQSLKTKKTWWRHLFEAFKNKNS